MDHVSAVKIAAAEPFGTIARLLAAAPDVQEVLDAVVRLAVEHLDPCDFAGMSFVDGRHAWRALSCRSGLSGSPGVGSVLSAPGLGVSAVSYAPSPAADDAAICLERAVAAPNVGTERQC